LRRLQKLLKVTVFRENIVEGLVDDIVGGGVDEGCVLIDLTTKDLLGRGNLLASRLLEFTVPDKSLGIANRDLAVVEAIHPDGRLSARLDNHRHIEFKAGEHRHFDHGYAVTSHSSQGLTAERILVHADTRVHPDLLNSRFGYVLISRASHEATLFTDDMAKLVPQLGADVSKTSALEINQPSSVGQGIGLGL
jgi:ATP-dependent exoDNAse (exonuclease V) alpha subunit